MQPPNLLPDCSWGLPVRTGIRAGEPANLGEAVFYKLLDGLQEPTDWLYEQVVPLEKRLPGTLGPER